MSAPATAGVGAIPIVVNGRWPAAMFRSTAAEYLDMSTTYFDRVKETIPSFQHVERGERCWMREDLDAYLRWRREQAVKAA